MSKSAITIGIMRVEHAAVLLTKYANHAKPTSQRGGVSFRVFSVFRGK